MDHGYSNRLRDGYTDNMYIKIVWHLFPFIYAIYLKCTVILFPTSIYISLDPLSIPHCICITSE